MIVQAGQLHPSSLVNSDLTSDLQPEAPQVWRKFQSRNESKGLIVADYAKLQSPRIKSTEPLKYDGDERKLPEQFSQAQKELPKKTRRANMKAPLPSPQTKQHHLSLNIQSELTLEIS